MYGEYHLDKKIQYHNSILELKYQLIRSMVSSVNLALIARKLDLNVRVDRWVIPCQFNKFAKKSWQKKLTKWQKWERF